MNIGKQIPWFGQMARVLSHCRITFLNKFIMTEKNAKQFVGENCLEESVTFLGWANYQVVENVLESNNIFVLPSWQEGLPNAMIEAMAAGLATADASDGSASSGRDGCPRSCEGTRGRKGGAPEICGRHRREQGEPTTGGRTNRPYARGHHSCRQL